MDIDDIVNVDVSLIDGECLFKGKVARDIHPGVFLLLRCFRERGLMCLKDTNHNDVESFAGLYDVKLIATTRKISRDPMRNRPIFLGCLYVDGDGVLRKTKSVPVAPHLCRLILVWFLPSEEETNSLFRTLVEEKDMVLEDLELIGCRVSHLSRDIGKMANSLKRLRLSQLEHLVSFPEEMCHLEHLRELHIDSCLGGNLPQNMGQLRSLQTLKLSYLFWLDVAPESFWQLSNLRELTINDCSFRTFPKDIVGLKRLEKLTLVLLDHLESLPEEMGHLSHLKELLIENCGLKQLPKSLMHLTSLYLSDLPQFVLHPHDMILISKLKQLSIMDCEDAMTPSCTMTFAQTIRQSVTLQMLEWNDTTTTDQMMASFVSENGSIVKGNVPHGCDVQMFERNKANHARAMECVVCLLAIRKWRNALNNAPKEMVNMIAIMLWQTRCDIIAWNY